MTPHKEYFSIYKQINGINVLMKNDTSCKIVGIGLVCIKIFDGIKKIIFNVANVLNLKKNFIFLDTLEANGCRYFGENEVMKLNK